jgi:hypothetical protein
LIGNLVVDPGIRRGDRYVLFIVGHFQSRVFSIYQLVMS